MGEPLSHPSFLELPLLIILSANTGTMWRGCRVVTLLLISFVLTSSVYAQQWPSTLLWRITGKGLSSPSYLYGTMHLQDRRLFHFGDSLYSALERTEGFAMEVNFNEFMDSMFMQQIRNAEDRYLDEEEVEFNREGLDRTTDSVLKQFGVKGNKISKKELKKIRERRINTLLQEGEMPTIVDAYLYGLALRQRKWTGGIEDVNDQMPLLDELGGDLSPEEVFQPEDHFRFGLESMIRIYLAQDLQKIADFADGTSGRWRDEVLIRRNVKMAKRMDSLSAIRTMFFAVGAAHLPGDSGVIRLLRDRGFKVEPVFSSKKLEPEAYSRKLDALPWARVEDEDQLYTIEMPGTPTDYNMLGQVFKMKMFFDITTMTFYMTGHGIGKVDNDQDIDRMFRNIAERMGVQPREIRRKKVDRTDVKGAEGEVFIDKGAYRFQLLQKDNNIFMLMTGSPKKENLSTQDVKRFFSSFKPMTTEGQSRAWATFRLEDKAFSVQLPGMPKRNMAMDSRSEGSGWNFTTYDFVDNRKGLYYLVQVRDIDRGYYINGDSVYFEAYRQDLKTKFDSLIRAADTIHGGFPAYKMEAFYKAENAVYKVYYVIRGNRVYSLIVGGHKDNDLSDAEHFFHSIKLEPYTPSEWKKYEGNGFFAMTPAPIILEGSEEAVTGVVVDEDKKDDVKTEEDEDGQEHYISFNTNEAISYEIFKDGFSPLFWALDDSSFLHNRLLQFREYGDSLVNKTWVRNGGLKGLEAVLSKRGTNNYKRLRFIVNGDSLYTLISFIPSQYVEDEKHDLFFNSFRVKTEKAPLLYTNKAKALLEALRSSDTSSVKKAAGVLAQVIFTKHDLPLLHNALFENYLRIEEEWEISINEKIAREFTTLGDASTVSYIQKNYFLLEGEKERFKYLALEVLADIQTDTSYNALKKLLLTGIPSSGSPDGLEYSLKDSLALTLSLYPEILSLSGDSLFTPSLAGITYLLLDSNLLDISKVLPYKKNFYARAERIRADIEKNETEDLWWNYYQWIPFLSKFREPESYELIRSFMALPVNGLKFEAAIELLKNDQSVPSSELVKLAEDKEYRLSLFEKLKQMDRLSLMPAKYASVRSLSESELYNIAVEEFSGDLEIKFIGERNADFRGKKQKFYLFTISFNEEGTVESYLGVAGPYGKGNKSFNMENSITDLYWEETLQNSQVDRLFKAFLSEASRN